jgi:hypothetical protein
VPIVHRVADGRIDLQAMRLTDLLAAGVQRFAGREGVIVLGVNEEDRRRDVVNGGQEPRSQLRRAIKAIAGSGKTTTARSFGSRSAKSTVSELPNEWPIAATSRAST